MHQIQCSRCTRALVASCSRISPAKPSRAAVGQSTRAISSTSSLSAWKRDTDKAKLKKEKARKVKLDEDSSYFSRASVQHAESSTSSDKGDKLLNLCDEAIVLSRSSSDPATFDRVKDILAIAAGIFNSKLHYVKAGQIQDTDMSYDVFLLRSSWLQVVRTLHALVGRGAIEVCSGMMCDYLEWEASLSKSGLHFKDGTEELPSAQAKQQGSGKMNEERFFHGPFLQDSSIILYDLFWHLTLSTGDLLSPPGEVKYRRAYEDKSGLRRSAIASRLWDNIAAIPVDAWRKPISVPWRPYTLDSGNEVVEAQKLISASMTMHGEALLRSKKLVQCTNLWKSAIPICTDGEEDFTVSLLHKIWTCLRRTARQLRQGDVSPRRVVGSAEEYFMTLHTLLDLLVRHQWPEKHAVKPMDGESSLEQLMDHVVSADRTLRLLMKRGIDGETEARVKNLVRRLDAVLQFYMVNWSDASTHWYRPPPLRSLKLCNNILYRLITGDTHEQPAPDAALKFLQLMADDTSDLPAPDRTTATRLLRAAREVGDTKVAGAVMRALRGAALQEPQGEGVREKDQDTRLDGPGSVEPGIVSSPPPSSSTPRELIKSNFLVLAEEALQHGDVGRMVSLLKSAEKRANFEPSLSHFLDATADQVVFLLYPTLDNVTRRAKRLRATASSSSTKRTEAVNKVAYNPLVLTLVLQLAIDQGRTGLAERVWRLIKRASKPKEGQNSSPGWPISIRAYSLIMTLYAKEVERFASLSSRPMLYRHRGLMNRRSGGTEVRGWGRVLNGPLRTRLPSDVRLGRQATARIIVKQEYQELKDRWLNGTAEPANDRFWKAIDRVFRRKGRPNQNLQLDNDEDVAFYNGLMQDMAASTSAPTPS